MMAELRCELEQVKGRIIFMSMYNDIKWGTPGNHENCSANALRATEYARKFPQGRWSFLGLGSEKKWSGTHARTAEGMMLKFAESAHPLFRTSSAFERRELRSKGGGKTSIHINGSNVTIELLLRTVISAN